MEASQPASQEFVNHVYAYAANLLVKMKKNSAEVRQLLITQGLDAESAAVVVSNLEIELRDVEQARARKDLLHGGLWCAGGVALTVADSGFIFWGAIIVGGIQFFKGLINLR
ncbi:hypothetical protein HHL22_02305 [Hymenobacter sp. RP-2-7]|uniref:Uncharacterized protein n=1 Tax=Hymenobacter polaris TaxID=2682546 RepID=A0A7Y0AB22_9BACT|nr:hypothetical protein [Hymenobacter polaris]NML64028.1 hypothetical protein [Hymenobacter polaris]